MPAQFLRLLPRIAMLVTAVAELVTGDVEYGVFCLIAVGLTLIPAIHARHLDAGIPLELELALLWLMLADMTLGNGLDLYRHFAWFDKVLHFSSSLLVGLMGFLAIYVVHLTHRTKFHPLVDGIAILLVTLGLGALWEIGEYGVDQLFGRASQGSPGLAPLDDTMIDLMLDGMGGILGAIVGPLYMKHSRRSHQVTDAFAKLIGERKARAPRDRTTTSVPRRPAHTLQ